jgi:hypothetical protein
MYELGKIGSEPLAQLTTIMRTKSIGKLSGLIAEFWPLFGLWALVLAFFWPIISPFSLERSFILYGDFKHQFLPFHHFISSELWQGRLPLWNPYLLVGHPFQADVQSGVFYPVTLLFSLLGGPDGISYTLLEWQVVADFLLAA